MKFKILCGWDIIQACVISNHFWGFEISKHMFVIVIAFFYVMQVSFANFIGLCFMFFRP
jgi:hypothetical protein